MAGILPSNQRQLVNGHAAVGLSARKTVAILDYGSGNLHSVAKALEQVAGRDYAVRVSGERNAVLAAERIVFPGQGAPQTLIDKGFPALLRELGICPTLMDASEEDGGTHGLALLPGQVRDFRHARDARPADPTHGPIKQATAHPLWKNIEDGERFYFAQLLCATGLQTGYGRGGLYRSFTSAAAEISIRKRARSPALPCSGIFWTGGRKRH